MKNAIFLTCVVLVLFGCGGGGGVETSGQLQSPEVVNARPQAWLQESYLKAVNLDSNDFYGYSVAVSGDTMVVGTYAEHSNQTSITNGLGASSDNSATFAGAVYVYRLVNGSWSQEAYIKAPNAESGDNFGISVAIHGDTLVVGAMSEDSSQSSITNGPGASADNSAVSAGAAYVFKRTGSTWAEEAYLKASNAQAGDNFGMSVGISGDTIVVGAYLEDSNQTSVYNATPGSIDNSAINSGAAYIFKRTGTTWVEEAYLKATNSEAGDNFGSSVAISDNTVVVGSRLEDSSQSYISNGTISSADNSFSGAGAAYVFKRTGSTWTQEAYLKASNADVDDNFGASVAISGETIVVGAKLEDSNQTSITNGTISSLDNTANGSGAAYVFRRTGSIWIQEAYIKAPNAEAGDNFGMAVAISADTIIVGANKESSSQGSITNGTTGSLDNSSASSGAIYAYKRTNTSWTQEAYIKTSNSGANDNFGFSIAIDGDLVISGANLEDSGQNFISSGSTASADNSANNSGAAYIFRRSSFQ
jgi:hypothetical protein